MKIERQQESFKNDYERKQSHQTTYTTFLSSSQLQAQNKYHQLKQNSYSEIQNQSKIQSSISTQSIGSSSSQRKAISKWLSSHPSQIHKKTFKPKLSTYLLPKLRITNFRNLKYEFQLPFQKPKYSYEISDKEQLYQAEIGHFRRGIHINIHFNAFLILGDIIVTLILFTMSAFQAQLQQFTNYETKRLSVRLISNLCLAFLVIRNLIQCIKITTYHRRLIYRLQDILMHRITQLIFWADILIIIILCLEIQYEDVQLLGVLLLIFTFIKVFPLSRNFYILERIYLDSYRQRMWWNLLKMFLFNLFFAHFFAIVLLSFYYINKTNNWLIKLKKQNQSWYEIYIWAFYWAAGIVPSVGPGDIYPAIYQEALLIALLKLLTISVCVLIDVIRMDAILGLKYNLIKKIGIFRAQAKKDGIKNQLKKQIQFYLKRVDNDDTNLEFHERVAFLKSLPKSLYNKCLTELSKKRLKSLPYFNLLSASTLIQIALKMYQISYSPQNIILKASMKKPNRISILKNGIINFVYNKYYSSLNGTIIHTFKVDILNMKIKKPFLIDQLFIKKNNFLNFDIKAQTLSTILHIDLQDFFNIIRSIENDRQYFYQTYHSHGCIVQQWSSIECIFCENQFHTLFDCPKLHYIPIRQIVYLKYTQPGIFTSNEKRNIIYHRRRSKFRQKQKRFPFFMVSQFRKIQRLLGIHPLRINNMKNICNQGKGDQNLIEKQLSQSIEIGIENSIKQIESSQFKLPQQIQLSLKISDFNDREYLYKQNRQTIDNTKDVKHFRELKNKIFDLITQILEPQFHDFWDIQIDKLSNFKGYFSQQNPNRLNNTKLCLTTKSFIKQEKNHL